MTFRLTWRTYQQRLLDRLDSLLDDDRLHVVAGPGSGKTVLGLEVLRRINQPTLILAPTITIRDQWVERLVEHFLPPESPRPDWVSTDIRCPKPLTVATYQALHSLCGGTIDPADETPAIEEDAEASLPGADPGGNSGGGEAATGSDERRATRDGATQDAANGSATGPVNLPEALLGFQTVVVDEAHHLRAEWWRTLTFAANHLKPTLVALTATPPYDVPPHEWRRYEEFCGPVDAQVAVPELVLQGDLCPHQDYVFLSTPAENEQATIRAGRTAIEEFTRRLRANDAFTGIVASHPWVTATDEFVEDILEHPEALSAMVVYLHSVAKEVPPAVLRVLAIRNSAIPDLNLEWLEILLTRVLYHDVKGESSESPALRAIRRDLLEIGAIERRKVVLRNPANRAKLLTTSRTKLHSIDEIVRVEAGAQGPGLRCVVLTDFIRKAEMPASSDARPVFEDLGVVPIFETLRVADVPGVSLGVLCGSLVVVPSAIETTVREAAGAAGIGAGGVVIQPLAHAPDYCAVRVAGEDHHALVRLMTAVFERGRLTVLVGTKSLLGEGWDAPTINTLVLASFVGSYVQSNQMRGRCIRVDREHPAKVANVWHLVCVEPGAAGPGNDYELLERRFDSFLGVGATSPTIESGVARLDLGPPPFTASRVAELNARTCGRAVARDQVRRAWSEALAKGENRQMRDAVETDADTRGRRFVFADTLAALLMEAAFLFTFLFGATMRALAQVARVLDHLHLRPEFLGFVAIAAAVAAVFSLPVAGAAVYRWIRHGTPERSLRQIGQVVLDSLMKEGSIGGAPQPCSVFASTKADGRVVCWIDGATGREQAFFVRALAEVSRPIENPRYLLARPRWWRVFREDYFTVPDVFGRRKEVALFFAQQWRRRVGPVDLVYTRTPEGRQMLLRARGHSLAATFQARADRVTCWK